MHILSATVLFGTGMGTAFLMLRAYLSRYYEAIAVTTRNAVPAISRVIVLFYLMVSKTGAYG